MMQAMRRNTELGLILLAAVITTGAYALASLGRSATLPADVVPFLGVLLLLLGVGHLAVRRLAPSADGMLLPLAALLNGIGYVFIARLDHDLAALQSMWTLVGVLAFVLTLIVVRRARDLERYRYTLALLGVGLLMLPLMPGIGRNINGSRIWVRVAGASFQPGELAKIVLAVFFASYLVEKQALLSQTRRFVGLMLPQLNFKHLGPLLLAWAGSLVVMMAEKDLGSSLLFFALFVTMLWIATARAAYLGMGAVLFGAGSLIAWETFAHVENRVHIWLNPWTRDDGFQLVQSMFALSAGGLAGTGLSLGNPQRIPVVTTDFIFAAIGEELGLFGTTAVLAAILLMVGAGLRIALRADSPFEKLLAAGLTTILGVQSFIIIGGVIRVVPLTGVTLPFVSYGGSSLVANYVLLALLLRISSDSAERQAAALAVDETRVSTS
jgi:peptidoglycan glycosyltransferase